MSKSEKFWIYVSFHLGKRNSPLFILMSVTVMEVNVIKLSIVLQNTFNQPIIIPSLGSSPTPHNCRYQDITGFSINSCSESFVTVLKYFHPPFTSAVFLRPSKASSGYLRFFETTVILLAFTSPIQRCCCCCCCC
jgi:hypothetical protein